MSTAALGKKKKQSPEASPKPTSLAELELDVSSNVATKLLDYVYGDEADFSVLSLQEVMSLFQATKVYGLERLEMITELHICKSLSVKDIVKTLKWVVSNKYSRIESFCFAFILKV